MRPTGSICITNQGPSSTVLEDDLHRIIDEDCGISMDDALHARFYEDRTIIDAQKILHGFEASLFVCP